MRTGPPQSEFATGIEEVPSIFRACETREDAKSTAGWPAMGDQVSWRNQNYRPGRRKISTGKVVGFDHQKDQVYVTYELSLGRGQKKTKTIPVNRELLIDPS